MVGPSPTKSQPRTSLAASLAQIRYSVEESFLRHYSTEYLIWTSLAASLAQIRYSVE